MAKTTTLALGLTSIVAGLYLCCWPVPIQPVAWSAPTPPGYSGGFAANEGLGGLRTIDTGAEVGPEHIAMGPDGKLYAAMTSGNIVRMDPDGAHQETFANTGGRVLGFAFDPAGRMIAADAMKGLLAIAPDGAVSVLATHVTPDDRIGYANSVVIAPDGTVFFTDASTRFLPREWGGTYEASVLDVLEQSSTGRILAYDPETQQVRIVARGLSFANGLALSDDGHTLFVAETGRYCVWRIDGRARDLDMRSGSPQAEPLLENLPGYPDNLMRGRDGRIWVGLFKPRNPAADRLAGRPFLRTVLLRLPRFMLPLGASYGHVFAIDEGGNVTEDLQDPSGRYPETTGVTETEDRLYIHSLHAHGIGWLPRSPTPEADVEDVYILRSIREHRDPTADWCAADRTGFEPFPSDPERFFSFWSVQTQPQDGSVVDAKARSVAELRACFGPTDERTRHNFYAELELGGVSLRGRGECVAVGLDVPETGLVSVHCHLVLSDGPAPYVGGVLTTNTLTSEAPFGGDTQPPGYVQASIATIRVWKARRDAGVP